LQWGCTMHEPNHPRMLLTSREAAAVLAISTRTLWQMTHDGVIPCVRLGSTSKKVTVRYSTTALQDWINQNQVGGKS